MMEDFGWSGDEFLMGDCMDDWAMVDLEREVADEDFSEDSWDFPSEAWARRKLEEDLKWNPEDDADDDGAGEDCPLDGDHESALASCGWGTDEDYGLYDDFGDF